MSRHNAHYLLFTAPSQITVTPNIATASGTIPSIDRVIFIIGPSIATATGSIPALVPVYTITPNIATATGGVFDLAGVTVIVPPPRAKDIAVYGNILEIIDQFPDKYRHTRKYLLYHNSRVRQ